MADAIAVLNAGSSSFKFSLFVDGAQGIKLLARGLDAIVFTAGIGENSRSLRERVCRDAEWLGVELDAEANQRNAARISTAASRVSAWVIPTNEELMIARHTRNVLGMFD